MGDHSSSLLANSSCEDLRALFHSSLGYHQKSFYFFATLANSNLAGGFGKQILADHHQASLRRLYFVYLSCDFILKLFADFSPHHFHGPLDSTPASIFGANRTPRHVPKPDGGSQCQF
jgi:hypothetical protein